jgi:protein gp37
MQLKCVFVWAKVRHDHPRPGPCLTSRRWMKRAPSHAGAPHTVEGVADRSSIEWTQATWNPVTGCDRTSPGCDHCYALRLAARLKAMGQPHYQRDGDPTTSGPGFGVTRHHDVLALPLAWRQPRLVFVNSMSDLFHPQVPDEFVFKVFSVMASADQHTFQVLTKRSQRLRSLARRLEWPANVWIGVSVENARYRFRIDHLRTVPARVRFLSIEPLIGPVGKLDLSGVHWVIAGGESGPQARPADMAWLTDIRDQCIEAGVAFFFKQWGGRTPKAGGRLLEGIVWDEMPALAGA